MIDGKEQTGDVEAAASQQLHNHGRQFPDADEREVDGSIAQNITDPEKAISSNPIGPSSDDDDKTIVSWGDNDPENPHNWPSWKRNLLVLLCMVLIINSTMASALPSNAIPFIAAQYGITSPQQKVLPISVFMIGYVFGPLLWGPLSEEHGRRILTLVTFVAFCVWTLACAVAPGWAALIVFRLFVGVFASSAISVVPGIMADMFPDHRTRGRAMAFFMATTVFGPLFAPIVSGYVSPTIGWRWSFWIGLIYACATFVPLAFLPETLGPVLLVHKARRLRKADPVENADVVAPRELEPKPTLTSLVSVVLTRPLRMIATELIVSCTCAYLALIYSIFYMSFQAFPLIFGELYGLSPGKTGLAFLSIGGGSLVALPAFFAYDPILRWFQRHPRYGVWACREEFRRLPLACAGGPLFVISLFWLGFSSRPGVPVIVPILAGVPFGAGFMLIFMALLNYLTDAYEIYAASANGASSMARSFFAVILPLATTPMFQRLGIAGACSLLGGLSAIMCIIPFIFIWKGERIRQGSKFCIALKQQKDDAARKDEERRHQMNRQNKIV
ncbi:major facilitator superfamily transporter [Plectosphaerella plurivora]|uniref:Major facilitator superfamily transporter n=1 Tax=Plectosphaerella plurivora TaxID=936078 RepID=A0A9P9A5F6_9PEZI|nr:major facilitator superfamily transporter [Plectosphaerella plurivora]